MTKTTRRRYSTLILVFCWSAISNAEFSNPTSGGIFQGMATDPNTVKENEKNQTSGREYKAEDAQNQGNTGGGIAIGLGAAMIGVGIPMAMSPEIVTMIAGWDLIAKGGLELAQGAANLSSANKNGAQKDQLMANVDQRSPAQAQQAQAAQVNNPELDKMLGESGVNADDFKRRLASGEFKSGADILAALGKTGFSAEDLAAGQALGDLQTKGFVNSTEGELGKPNNAVISGNEGAGQELPASDPDASSTTIVAGPGAEGSAISASSTGGAAGTLHSDGKGVKMASRNPEDIAGKEESAKPSGLFDMSQLISSVLGDKASLADQALAMTIVRQELANMGIQMPVKGQNIFDTAHRNFGNFRRWRKGPKVAAR